MAPQHHFCRWGGYELIHWTGHETRLARPRITRADLSDDAQAFEELVAEFGAAMVGQHFGFTPSPRADHASYLAKYVDGGVMWTRMVGALFMSVVTAAESA